MQARAVSPLAPLIAYRRYIVHAAWSEFRHHYAGTQFGVFWHIIHPALSLIVYAAIFTFVVADRRWFDSPALFVLSLCAGILTWMSFSETLLQGSDAFLRNVVYLRRLPFPGEVFVAKSIVSSSIGSILSVAFLAALSLALGQSPTWSWLSVLPIVLLFQGLAFGMALILAPLRVVFRDLGELLRAIVQLWMWTLPIAYPVTLVPESIRPWLAFNPPFTFIEAVRDALLRGSVPQPAQWLVMFAWVVCFVVLGSIVLTRCRSLVKDCL